MKNKLYPWFFQCVGDLSWEACEKCKHGDGDNGGCKIMDDGELGNISNFEICSDSICCTKWEPKTEADDNEK